MDDYAFLTYLVVAMGMFMVGVSKGGGWASLAALAVPFVGLVLPIDDVIGMMLPVLMPADFMAIGVHRRKRDNRLVLLLIPTAVRTS